MKSWSGRRLGGLTPTQFIIVSYLVATAVSTVLLLLPLSLKPGVRLAPVDALFTAVSGISVTGLGVIGVADTFSVFGTFVLLGVMQFGGIGIMTLGTFLWLLLGRNITLSYRRLIMVDQNRYNLSGVVQLMRSILLLALSFEAAGTVVLGVYFRLAGYSDGWLQSFYYGLFHSVSAYTNAGFDLFGDSMLSFAEDYFVQSVTMVLLILGAIGFPVLLEVREYVRARKKGFRFSLYAKVTVTTFFLLVVAGAVGIWIVESDSAFAGMPWHQKLFFSLFNSVTTRSGGLATMDVNEFTGPTQMLMSILMFIGASPSSVGGGIRTTTFAVMILTLITFATGRSEVRVFRRSVGQEDVTKSFVVFTFAAMLVVTSVLLLDALEREHYALDKIIFEVCSAFGTSGLSTGITGDLSVAGKALLSVLMFIGRIGILSLLLMFRMKRRAEKYHFPREDLIIG
ncbi:TrkH family potassium uptake protein [Paenibacillus flagellatus]|uniref:Ktr system potassium uptake protein D n=1 Tax=Paenibacillus flagellatus TaxID=2211139 RepID=A0A2V5KPM0_9BACL|nr:potassium transporter TrkG [Paenibacillus flagellatus]PYI57450.1 Ktr system potassium uptake protein D [Paenibacillus flagellatus]